MNEFDEALSDVLKVEASRKPVWVVDLRCDNTGLLPMLAWGPCRALLRGSPRDGQQAVMVPGAPEGHRVWTRPVNEVYKTREEAERAALEKTRAQAKIFGYALDAVREADMLNPE